MVLDVAGSNPVSHPSKPLRRGFFRFRRCERQPRTSLRESGMDWASRVPSGHGFPAMIQNPQSERRRESSDVRPRSRFLKLRCSGFPPPRGSRKSAQGQRPTGAPPWVPVVTESPALKGRPDVAGCSRSLVVIENMIARLSDSLPAEGREPERATPRTPLSEA